MRQFAIIYFYWSKIIQNFYKRYLIFYISADEDTNEYADFKFEGRNEEIINIKQKKFYLLGDEKKEGLYKKDHISLYGQWLM